MRYPAPSKAHKAVSRPVRTETGGGRPEFEGRETNGGRAAAESAGFPPRAKILQMQRVVGNRAVAQWLQARTPDFGGKPTVPVQRMSIVKDKTYRKAIESDAPERVIDTAKLKLSDRNALVLNLELEGNESLLNEILTEWGSMELKGDDDFEEIFGWGEEIAALQNKKPEEYEEEDHRKIEDMNRRLAEAKLWVDQNDKNPSIQIYRDVIITLMRDLSKLGGQGVEDQAPAELDVQIGPGERRNYRDDIRRMGTWGGEAEAESIAAHFHMLVPVFVIRKGIFRQVTQVGTGHVVGNRALVHLGNHYEVAQGIADGMAVGGQTEWLKTGKTGDCLFESMLLIRNNGRRASMEETLERIQKLRNRVSANLADAAIDESIQEMLVFGDAVGAGPETAKLVADRRAEARRKKIASDNEAAVLRVDRDFIDEHLKKLSELEYLESFGFEAAIDAYLQEREKNPKSSGTIRALSELDKLFRLARLALREQKGEFDTDYSEFEKTAINNSSKDPIDRPKDRKLWDQIEKSAREDALTREDIRYIVSPNNKSQYLITVSGVEGEFVMDKIGQLVPRFTRRNISDINIAELKGKHDQEAGLYPSNLSPYEDARRQQDARGTGSNKIRNESAEMHHVQGSKPSDYLSATASSSDALNPQGKAFDAAATVVIDLSYIDPEQISALYTSQGMRYFLLDMFEGDRGATVEKAEREQREKAPSSMRLAKGNAELSEKEWQALLDVIRTKEVLIGGLIPKEAVRKE